MVTTEKFEERVRERAKQWIEPRHGVDEIPPVDLPTERLVGIEYGDIKTTRDNIYVYFASTKEGSSELTKFPWISAGMATSPIWRSHATDALSESLKTRTETVRQLYELMFGHGILPKQLPRKTERHKTLELLYHSVEANPEQVAMSDNVKFVGAECLNKSQTKAAVYVATWCSDPKKSALIRCLVRTETPQCSAWKKRAKRLRVNCSVMKTKVSGKWQTSGIVTP